MLLNRQSLAVAKFASKDIQRPVLSALCITPTHVVATDSYHLLEVEHVKQDDKVKPDGIRNDSGTGLIPAESALHASKNIPTPKDDTLFALKHAFSSLDGDGKRMTLTTTDIMQEKSVEALLIDGKFPDYKQVFPKGQPVARIMVNAQYLKDMADYFAKHGEGDKVLIEFHGEDQPLVFRGETVGDHQQARGLIMPMRMAERANNS
jgi:DNA polymerase III sliding clamp (beta) subunit (PCNA family)